MLRDWAKPEFIPFSTVKFHEVNRFGVPSFPGLPHVDGCNPSKTRNAISKYVAAHGEVLPACIV